jgi:hypothetical protein
MARSLALLGVIWLAAGTILAGSAPVLGSDTLDDALPGFILGARADEPCPADSITGQIPSACNGTRWYFYSDLEFCSGTLCRRVRCEDFPKTGLLDPNNPAHAIGTIRWFGVNIDDALNGCSKGTPGTYPFRIRFYNDSAGAPNPAHVYEEVVTPYMTDTGETVLFSGATIPAIRWGYAATLTSPRQMANGWFSICGQGVPGCYSLWEGSGADGGNNKFYQWFEVGGTIPGPAVTDKCDLNYCFGVNRTGACCHTSTGICENNVHELACRAPGDIFHPNTTCDMLEPPCVLSSFGACCFDDCTCQILTEQSCYNWPGGAICRGDANCDGLRDFDDIDAFVAVLGGQTPCWFENLDVNADGGINFDDISPFVDNLWQDCPEPELPREWLGPGTNCSQCSFPVLDCNSPTHPEQEPCGADTNGGCNSHSDPNDPNSPPDPNAWEHLGVLDLNHPTVVCGTVWSDNWLHDTDWYAFSLPMQGLVSWVTETESVPLISTPVFGDANMGPPTMASCTGTMWGYWPGTPILPCFPAGVAPTDIFRAGVTYWWLVLPYYGAPFDVYPCALNRNDYRITITTTELHCDPCLQTDPQEGEPACGPGYVDTFNSGCDAGSGFPVQPAVDANTWYCGKSGTWTDPNGNAQVDYDWWKIVLTGTVKKRLLIQVQSAFNMRWELYSVPGSNCTSKLRLDYYEFDACKSNLAIYTTCLQPSNSVYYMRIVPTSAVSCTQWNTYRFQWSRVTEAPACTTCGVICTSSPDDVCQSDPNGPETNAGCNAPDPNNPANYMYFTAGNNTYGATYCGRLSTFTGGDGTPRADLDWFRFTLPTGRTKVVIRGKAMFRMSINITPSCADAGVAHGWDRPCKGTTTAATQTWTGLTPGATYTGVVIYGNGGGDGTGEQPLKQFFFGLPCGDSRNNYELELQAQA